MKEFEFKLLNDNEMDKIIQDFINDLEKEKAIKKVKNGCEYKHAAETPKHAKKCLKNKEAYDLKNMGTTINFIGGNWELKLIYENKSIICFHSPQLYLVILTCFKWLEDEYKPKNLRNIRGCCEGTI